MVTLVFGEQAVPFLEEYDELGGHLVEFMDIAVSVDVAEASADGVINEKQICELVPAAIVVLQGVGIFQAIGTYLHHGAVFGTAARSSIEPDNGALSVGDVLVLEVPEEHVSVVLGSDLDVTSCRAGCQQRDQQRGQGRERRTAQCYIHSYIHTYTYICVCIDVCVDVCIHSEAGIYSPSMHLDHISLRSTG